MNSRRRFLETMAYGRPDRVPYFEEGIRDDVLDAWRKQGLPPNTVLSDLFSFDRRVEIAPELEPRPYPKKWPTSESELPALRDRLDPDDPGRLPAGWSKKVSEWRQNDDLLLLRIHRGFFQTMGVSGWNRFSETIYLLADDPALVHGIMGLQGQFAARLVERILSETRIDAAIFSEPIAGNNGPLISPKMYKEYVLANYEPVLEVLRRFGVQIIILRTYANSRALIPSAVEWGFNCLWAHEVNPQAMDYRDIRREFGRDLRLVGGIDGDVLLKDETAIRHELEEKVPTLLAGGGYIPMSDGRVRANVPYKNYYYYRELLEKITQS